MFLKYRNKISNSIVFAGIYNEGLEDGFDYKYRDMYYLGNKIPYINTPKGKVYVYRDDYIVIEDDKKYTCKSSKFKNDYELV